MKDLVTCDFLAQTVEPQTLIFRTDFPSSGSTGNQDKEETNPELWASCKQLIQFLLVPVVETRWVCSSVYLLVWFKEEGSADCCGLKETSKM